MAIGKSVIPDFYKALTDNAEHDKLSEQEIQAAEQTRREGTERFWREFGERQNSITAQHHLEHAQRWG